MPTDLARLPDPVAAVRRLPRGTAVILRDATWPGRESLARSLRAATRRRGVLLLVAGDGALARRIGADGLHVPESLLASRAVAAWRRRNPHRLMSGAAHSLPALRRAGSSRCDLALLSPVFPTRSHPGAPTLGPLRAAALARASRLPVLALGGIDRQTRRRVPSAFAGYAAIGLFAR